MHHIPYAAQVAPCRWRDVMVKGRKAFEVEGPAFINALSVCPTGWKSDPAMGMEITQMAVDSCMFPLYEVEYGNVKVTYKPKEKLPVAEYMKLMGRFRHMFKPENAEFLEQIQAAVDERWEWLLGQDRLTRELEQEKKEKKAAG